jgi:hypothetical protein
MYREDLPITPNGKINIKALIAEVNNRWWTGCKRCRIGNHTAILSISSIYLLR